MDNSTRALAKLGSHLGNRILWFDGSNTVEPQSILDFMRPTIKLHVTQLTPDVAAFNMLAEEPINVKTKLDASGIQPDNWLIPQHYQDLDLDAFFTEKLDDWTGHDRTRREQRVTHELRECRAADKEMMLRLMIYIVDTLTDTGSVWGIGRGSSVSCFLLYLIGVHDIDSVEYDLNFSDFMKTT